jgi:hypothetical protein
MQILLSFYCRPDKLRIFTDELCKYVDTYNRDQVSVQVSTTTYSIQTPEFKLTETYMREIKNLFKRYNIILHVFSFDYGPIINTLKNDTKKYDISIFCNAYIPTSTAINTIIDYFNKPISKDTFICQHINTKDNVAIGNGSYYVTNHDMQNISYFLDYTFQSNYEVLFNFDTWLSFYIKLHRYSLISAAFETMLLYEHPSVNNCYINNIDRQIHNLNRIDFSRYFHNIACTDIINLKNNIKYHQQQVVTTNTDSSCICNCDAIRKCISIDNFYQQPLNVYKIAAQQSFSFSEKYNIFISNIIDNPLIEYFKFVISSILNIQPKNINITEHFFGYNSYNFISKPKSPESWICIVFLNPNASIDTGLSFYTNKFRINRYSEVDETTLENIGNFIAEDVIGNIFNRVVLFNSNFIHSLPFCKNNIFQYIEFT